MKKFTYWLELTGWKNMEFWATPSTKAPYKIKYKKYVGDKEHWLEVTHSGGYRVTYYIWGDTSIEKFDEHIKTAKDLRAFVDNKISGGN